MELFIPSVLLLLLAAAVIFIVLPRFGAPALAIISVVLLVFGIYQHMTAFGAEYRLSTWQLSLTSYVPYIMVGGVLVVSAFYLLSIVTSGTTAPTMPEMPTVAEMPSANTATNVVTAGVNNVLKGVSNTMGLGNKGNAANKGTVAAVANTAKNAVASVTEGVTNAVKGITDAITGNNSKSNNKGLLAGVGNALGMGNNASKNNKGFKVPGLNFPISQV